jgi:hypothetical protein
MLLPSSNELLVSAPEPRILIYGSLNVVLAPFHRGWVGFHSYKFSNPASRSAKMPAAFHVALAAVRWAPWCAISGRGCPTPHAERIRGRTAPSRKADLVSTVEPGLMAKR